MAQYTTTDSDPLIPHMKYRNRIGHWKWWTTLDLKDGRPASTHTWHQLLRLWCFLFRVRNSDLFVCPWFELFFCSSSSSTKTASGL